MTIDAQWRTVACPGCGGGGVVAVYSYDDFEGPGECVDCGGSGQLWIRPSGHLFEYPGGRAKGSWPGQYEHAQSYTVEASGSPQEEAGE